jgi:hypothetical protein
MMVFLNDEEASELAARIVELFDKGDVSTELAMQALTRVMAACLCDQEDILAKIKILVANLIVFERAYRIEMQREEVVS